MPQAASEMYHVNVVLRERAEAFDILACVCLEGRPEKFLVTVQVLNILKEEMQDMKLTCKELEVRGLGQR